MTDDAHGGPARTAAEPSCDPHEAIAAIIEMGDDREAIETENTSPRAWGFDVEEINRSYALAIKDSLQWGVPAGRN